MGVPTNESGYQRPDWDSVFDRDSTSHVLFGSFKNGKPQGFHHRPTGEVMGHARVTTTYPEHPNGVYTARVSLQGPGGKWVDKETRATMFPDDWTAAEVRSLSMTAADDAWRHDRIRTDGVWHGYATGRHAGRAHRYHIAGAFAVDAGNIVAAKSFYPAIDQPLPGVDESGIDL